MRQAGATLHRGAGTALHRGARAFLYRGPSRCGAQAPDAQAQQLSAIVFDTISAKVNRMQKKNNILVFLCKYFFSLCTHLTGSYFAFPLPTHPHRRASGPLFEKATLGQFQLLIMLLNQTWVCSPICSKANLLTQGSVEGMCSVYCRANQGEQVLMF